MDESEKPAVESSSLEPDGKAGPNGKGDTAPLDETASLPEAESTAGPNANAGEPAATESEESVDEESVAEESAPVAEKPKPAPAAPKKAPAPVEEEESKPPIVKQWYILKVQSNREESIRDGLMRRVAIAGLQDYFGEVIVPTEMRSEFKNGRKRVFKQKLYPGYLVVNMEINDDTWYLIRETPGIGDFTGTSGKPSPMQSHEVSKIIAKQEEKTDEAPKLKISFKPGDRVKIREGTFENFEGDVENIDEADGRVTVMINIFGRSTPVELEYWQIEAL